MIAILDYGAGNLRSVENTLEEVGASYRLARGAAELEGASKIILPGVGHFGQMIRAMGAMGVVGALKERIAAGVPFLGICLGLQALYERSEEAPDLEGFGLLPGAVRRFAEGLRVPHMGWNRIAPRAGSRLLAGLGPRPYLYFAHSYFGPLTEAASATCEYGETFTAAVERGNLFGVQFHPEKSGPLGLKIMKNFVEL